MLCACKIQQGIEADGNLSISWPPRGMWADACMHGCSGARWPSHYSGFDAGRKLRAGGLAGWPVVWRTCGQWVRHCRHGLWWSVLGREFGSEPPAIPSFEPIYTYAFPLLVALAPTAPLTA